MRDTIIGLDPGLTGAMALLDLDGDLLDAMCFDSADGRLFYRLSASRFGLWHQTHNVRMVVVENVHSMPKQGVSSTFKFGRATGAVEMMAPMLQLPMDYITPATWKRVQGLTGKEKDAARLMALRLWPQQGNCFQNKRAGQAVADAALLALAWLKKNPLERRLIEILTPEVGGEGPPPEQGGMPLGMESQRTKSRRRPE